MLLIRLFSFFLLFVNWLVVEGVKFLVSVSFRVSRWFVITYRQVVRFFKFYKIRKENKWTCDCGCTVHFLGFHLNFMIVYLSFFYPFAFIICLLDLYLLYDLSALFCYVAIPVFNQSRPGHRINSLHVIQTDASRETDRNTRFRSIPLGQLQWNF